MPQINTIHNNIIGVSFLDECQHSIIQELWQNRFQADRSTLVTATSETNIRELLNQIAKTIQDHGHNLGGLSPILVGYLDLQKEDARQQAEILEKLNKNLVAVGCTPMLTIQFGFVGELPCEDASALRTRIGEAVAVANASLCLVGKYTFEQDIEYNWKATVILLDLMRRSTAPTDFLPTPGGIVAGNCVGFLRYGEFNQKKLDELNDQLARLDRSLSSEGREELLNSIRAYLREIRQRAEKEFPVNGKQHPFHPDMIVENTFLHNNQRKAERGLFEPYNRAAKATVEAVNSTAGQLEKQMKNTLIPDEKKAEELMRQYLERVGIGCIRGLTDLSAAVGVQPDDQVSQYDSLMLRYEANKSCGEKIDAHLQRVRDYTRYQCQKEALARFGQALEKLTQEYEKQVEENEKKRNALRVRLNGMPSMEKFLTGCLDTNAKLLKYHFNPIAISANTKKVMLYREPGDAPGIQKDWAPGNIYEISRNHGGLVQIDDAKLKCLHIFLAACSEENLKDLIK